MCSPHLLLQARSLSLFEAIRQLQGKTVNCELKRVAGAMGILWYNSVVLADGPADEGNCVTVHLSTPQLVNPQDKFKRQARIEGLGEHLVNLQAVRGFEWCLNEIYSDSLETGLAKLIPAGMMLRKNIPFLFSLSRHSRSRRITMQRL